MTPMALQTGISASDVSEFKNAPDTPFRGDQEKTAVRTAGDARRRPRSRSRKTPRSSCEDLNFHYGKYHALQDINIRIPETAGHRVHRPVRLRQVHAAAHLQPDLRAVSRSARQRRDPARRQQCPGQEAGSQPAAGQGGHGVPEADAVPHVGVRQCRFWRQTLRATVACRHGRSCGMGLAQGRAVGRSEGQAAPGWYAPVRWPAAASVYCPGDCGQAGSAACWTSRPRPWIRSPHSRSKS